jgi:hypothetical protein
MPESDEPDESTIVSACDQAFELQWGTRLPDDNVILQARHFLVGIASLLIAMRDKLPDEDVAWNVTLLVAGEHDVRALEFVDAAPDDPVRELIEELVHGAERILTLEAC